ncbi:MAG: hypothetical protein WA775_02915 [Psychroserpens sp.]|uniref:hypothetical protein n=1 Tax=Psychroserpens sp. TaxID=2020870 RepID=UPI003C9E0D3A
MLNLQQLYNDNKFQIESYWEFYRSANLDYEWHDRLHHEMKRLHTLNKSIELILTGQTDLTLSIDFKTQHSTLNESRDQY